MSNIPLIDIYRKQKVNLVPIPKGSGKALNIIGGWGKYQKEICVEVIKENQDFAVILGSISDNLIVLDFDDCDDLELINKIFPNALNRTLVVRTGDGYHMYLKIRGKLPGNFFMTNEKCGMEIKSSGTYVVGAGCEHYDKDENNKYMKSGKQYNVISNTTTIAELKADGEIIIKKIESLGWKRKGEINEADGHVITTPTKELILGKWPKGNRYGNGFKLALRRFHMDWDYEDVLNEAFRLNNTCDTPHNESEVERWVNDALTQYKKNKEDSENTYFKPKDEPKRKQKQDLYDTLADYVQTLHRFKAMRDNEELLIFDGKIYKRFADSIIKEELEKKVPGCDTSLVNEVINKIKRQNFVDRNKFDADPDILTLENCIFNIEKMEIYEHDPSNLSCIKLPVEYKDTTKNIKKNEYSEKDIDIILENTKFLEYLKQCFTIDFFDFEQFYTVLEIMASCLLKTSKFDKAFMFIGVGGNGKSVLIDFITSILGEENISDVPIQELAHERFKKAELYSKMANLYADIEADELRKTGTLKALISGDRIIAERKHQQPFYFKNYAKMIFSANRFPQVTDQTDAMFRRFIIVNWQRKFSDKTSNKDLRKILISDQGERNSVFNFLIHVAKKLDKRNHFRYGKRVDELRKEWNKHSDPVMLFIEELVEDKEESFESKPSVYKKYREYCIHKEIQPETISKFGRIFGEYYETVQHKGRDGINRKMWQDIHVKDLFNQGILSRC